MHSKSLLTLALPLITSALPAPASIIGLVNGGPLQSQRGVPTSSQTLSALISSNANLTVKAGLLARDPYVQSVYTGLRNATCFFPSDAAYAVQAEQAGSSLAFRDGDRQRAEDLLQCVQGVWPVSSFNRTQTWAHSFLYNSSWTNVTDGQYLAFGKQGLDVLTPVVYSGLNFQAQLSLSRNNGSVPPTVLTNRGNLPIGQQSAIVQADIPFVGGLVHIVDAPVTLAVGLEGTGKSLGLKSMQGNLTRGAGGAVQADGYRDVTYVFLSNSGYEKYRNVSANFTAAQRTAVFRMNSFNGSVLHSDMFTAEGTEVEAQSGDKVRLTRDADNTLRMNGAMVVYPDVPLQNGAAFITDE
ncbi:MAG: hypothetical protein M1814_001469 [Vezdaea aestivalis]|nr:MAG: hypothetical protein M1814_001469 [Vezdaea aestivalis]